MDGVNGSTGRLLLRSSAPKSQKVSSVLVGGHIVPVPVTPVRPLVLSSSVYQAVEASGSISETTRSTSPYIPRRYSAFKSVPSRIGKGQMFGAVSTAQTGLCGESEKVNADSHSEDRVSGICNRLRSVVSVSSPPREGDKNSRIMPPGAATTICSSASVVSPDRNVDSDNPRSVTGTLTLQIPANAEVEGFTGWPPELQCSSSVGSGVQIRTKMVVPAPAGLEWQITHQSSPRSRDHNGLINDGLGAVCNGTTTQGLWSPSEKLNHINVLELKAAMFAVMEFAKNLSQIHIHLRLDNLASVAQINPGHIDCSKSQRFSGIFASRDRS